MKNKKEKHSIKAKLSVPYEKLKKSVNVQELSFETTQQIPKLRGIIGQERAKRSLEFGLHVKQQGYNIYVSGVSGTGKTSYTTSLIKEFAKKERPLYDWCYVYNFQNRFNPRVLQLPVGMGKTLKKDMETFVKDLKVNVPRAFQDEDYQRERTAILRTFQEESGEFIETLNEIAKEYGFSIKQSGTNFISVPLIEGKPIDEEEYEQLNEEQLKEIEEKSALLQERAVEISNEIGRLEKKTKERLEKLESKRALKVVEYPMEELKKKYKEHKEVVQYLQDIQKDILENIKAFKVQEEEEQSRILGLLKKGSEVEDIEKYKVNLLVDHSETQGAPVIVAEHPTYYHLMGKVEYENKMGVLTTDFTKIKPGYLHLANGGYIILQVMDILTNPYAWEALKRALKTSKLIIENLGEQLGLIPSLSIKPEDIPLNVKVILIGNTRLYQLLYGYDEDFHKLFKIKVDFDGEMPRTFQHVNQMASFIATKCRENHLKPFDDTAVAKVIEYSSRIAGNQNKLSTRFRAILEILYESHAWAEWMGEKIVTEEHVEKAMEEKRYRYSLYEEKIQEMIADGDILLDTQGEKIGQVNGLAVYHLGEYDFGKPSRITATTYVGEKGIINIERESQMSGKLHNKGVYILSGYLGEKFAQEHPLALSAHLVFEQSYGSVDGDSASSAELYAILSSLSDLPIKQGIAVTGSVNQRGEIQPIGGVNEKIEGFFLACKGKGLTGEQGVLIPHQNVKNLMLKDEVMEAVKKGIFHIYQAKSIEEGIELLTGVPAGQKDSKGHYPENTVYGKVAKKLKTFLKYAKNRNYS